jgi:hypothetical protein
MSEAEFVRPFRLPVSEAGARGVSVCSSCGGICPLGVVVCFACTFAAESAADEVGEVSSFAEECAAWSAGEGSAERRELMARIVADEVPFVDSADR